MDALRTATGAADLRHGDALLELSRSRVWRDGNRDAAFRLITELGARSLRVERVSVWLFEGSHDSIVCSDLYQDSFNQHERGRRLTKEEHPRYFSALQSNRLIAADDAHSDPRTREFARDYLDEHGITSMLDVPIIVEATCVGVVCLEHVGPKRRWTPEEQSFAGSLGDFAALAFEVEHRRRAEDALREREEQLQRALAAAGMGTWTWSGDDVPLHVSPRIGPSMGREPGWPSRVSEYFKAIPEVERSGVRQAVIATIEEKREELYLRHPVEHADGSIRWLEIRAGLEFDAAGEVRRIAGTVVDITERKVLEAQLLHAQRMEGIGRLAGGIAHDFNNLLTAIQCSIAALEERCAADPIASEDLAIAADATRRASKLTGQLLAFARKQPQRLQDVDVNALVGAIGMLLHRIIGEHIELHITVSDMQLSVRADPSNLEQVLVNLAVNARDAMPRGGLLRLETELVAHDDLPSGLTLGVKSPEWVLISVCDEGSGISEANLPHIFEPFFTTKSDGAGTGLGLSTCYGIVRQLGGDIVVRSVEGAGTTFTVALPRSATNSPGP